MINFRIRLHDTVSLESDRFRQIIGEHMTLMRYSISIDDPHPRYRDVRVFGSFMHPLLRDMVAWPSHLEQAVKFEKTMKRLGA